MHEMMKGSKVTADQLKSQALKMYGEIVDGGKLQVYGASLDDVDFDKIVAMWAR